MQVFIVGSPLETARAMTDNVCEECELKEVCKKTKNFGGTCWHLTVFKECWKRKE